MRRLSSANGIDITTAIWFEAGRLHALRTLGSALLSIVDVALGASLGREGAPKQTGAVVANLLADSRKLSDEQRRLLVACGAGAGMAAAYGVPLGGAVFAVEVLRGVLVLPALTCSLVATMVPWTALPDAPTYTFPAYANSAASTSGRCIKFELTAHDRSLIVPLLLAVTTATLVSRTIEARSIYDARLTDEQVQQRLRQGAPSTH